VVDVVCLVDEVTQETMLKPVHKDTAAAAAADKEPMQTSRHLMPHDAVEPSKDLILAQNIFMVIYSPHHRHCMQRWMWAMATDMFT